jgi:hypothetical protein
MSRSEGDEGSDARASSSSQAPSSKPEPPAGLCDACVHRREVTSGRGTRFIFCLKHLEDSRYPKYPTLPVTRCSGWEPRP